MQPAFLQEGEAILRQERRHPLSALDAWLGIAFLLLLVWGAAFAVAAFIDARAVPYAIAASAVALLLAGAWALAVWFRVSTSLNIVTAERVYHAHGKLRFFLSQTTYDRVTDLHVHQSFFGRRFGFGTVLVQTAGQGVALVGVRDPFGTKSAIEQAREAMVRRLVGDARRARKAAAGASAAAAGTSAAPRLAPAPGATGPTWTGRPTPASVVPQLAGLLPVVLFVGVFGVMGAGATGGVSLLMLGAVLVFGLVGVAMAVVRVRTTRFEVHRWGVALASGWLSRRRVEARYEKVTDVAVTQGVLGRILGFGSIRINTAGGVQAPIAFDGVQDPDRVKALIDAARQGSA